MSIKVPGMQGKRKSVFIGTGSETADTAIVSNPAHKTQFENTYKMKPDENKEARPSAVKQILNEVMDETLKDQKKYEEAKCSAMATEMSNVILRRVKNLNIPRYKFVCHVTLGQKCHQGVHTASRCVWDTSTDTYSSANWENDVMFAVAMLHAIYYE